MDFKFVVHPIDIKLGQAQRFYPVFCEIVYKLGRLSIHGVEAPMSNGNCKGGCGQIDSNYAKRDSDIGEQLGQTLRLTDGWTEEQWYRFLDVWSEWHLNDIHAGCEHQRALGWEKDGYDKHPSEPCPECGYKFGTSWHVIPVPDDVIEFLNTLPRSTKRPLWV